MENLHTYTCVAESEISHDAFEKLLKLKTRLASLKRIHSLLLADKNGCSNLSWVSSGVLEEISNQQCLKLCSDRLWTQMIWSTFRQLICICYYFSKTLLGEISKRRATSDPLMPTRSFLWHFLPKQPLRGYFCWGVLYWCILALVTGVLPDERALRFMGGVKAYSINIDTQTSCCVSLRQACGITSRRVSGRTLSFPSPPHPVWPVCQQKHHLREDGHSCRGGRHDICITVPFHIYQCSDVEFLSRVG